MIVMIQKLPLLFPSLGHTLGAQQAQSRSAPLAFSRSLCGLNPFFSFFLPALALARIDFRVKIALFRCLGRVVKKTVWAMLNCPNIDLSRLNLIVKKTFEKNHVEPAQLDFWNKKTNKLSRFNSMFEPKQITLSRLEQKLANRVEPAQLESQKENRMLKNDIFVHKFSGWVF